MRRAVFFLVIALFMALIIQPNLGQTGNNEVRVPTNTTTTAKTNDNIDIGISDSRATICLDAGNGGSDTGYTTADGVNEKDINLQLTLLIGEYLEEAEYNVVYTRTDDSTIGGTDESVSALERLNLASDQNADYLISIQCNDDVDATMNGYLFFTHPDPELIDLCNSINEQLMGINYSRFSGLDSDHYENFPILANREIPTVMIQIGYLTNADDYTDLNDEAFQNRIAKAIAMAILDEIN